MSISIYIGPYFRLAVGKTEVVEKHLVRQCQCTAPGFGQRSRFCSECGTPLTLMNVKAIVNDVSVSDVHHAMLDARVNCDDLIDLIHDDGDIIFAPNLLLANGKKCVGLHWDSYDDSGRILARDSSINPEGDKATLAREFAPHYKVLKELRGPERVTIEWGVVVTES